MRYRAKALVLMGTAAGGLIVLLLGGHFAVALIAFAFLSVGFLLGVIAESIVDDQAMEKLADCITDIEGTLKNYNAMKARRQP